MVATVTSTNQQNDSSSWVEKRTITERFFYSLYEWSNKKWVFYPLFITMSVYIVFSFFLTLGVNYTTSMPSKYFVFNKNVDVASLQKGDVVLYQYKNNEHLPFNTKFVKVVAGVEGDVVTHIGRDVYVNGKHIGTAKLFAGREQDGEALYMSEAGVIPKNHYFLYTPSEHSFDSRYRYVGFAPAERIKGKSFFSFGKVGDVAEN